MKKSLRLILALLKWAVIIILSVEVLSFLIITLINLLVYHTIWEGTRVNYDAYTLFQEGPRPTTNNPPVSGASKDYRTIWMFGGSTMRGSYAENDAKTIPSFLAGILNRGGKSSSFRVLNFGEDAFNSLLETKYLQKDLIELRPRPHLIIFYDGANESLWPSRLSAGEGPDRKPPPQSVRSVQTCGGRGLCLLYPAALQQIAARGHPHQR